MNAVDDEQYPIMYEKSIIKEQMINPSSFANMDVKSFDTKIGFITNLASAFIAMLSDYKEDSKEYKELKKRIDLLRYHQGVAIDATKGDIFVPPPRKWSHKQRLIEITTEMTEKEKNEAIEKNKVIVFENSICADKKPYFFTYIYKPLMDEYKAYKKSYDGHFKLVFNKSLKDVMYSEEKTKKEKYSISRYMKYMPVLKNNCIMNELTKYIESAEFKNKWGEKRDECFDYSVLKSAQEIKISEKDKFEIKQKLKIYNKKYEGIMQYKKQNNDWDSNDSLILLDESLLNDCLNICSDIKAITNIIIDLSYNDLKTKGKMAMWNVFGDQIIENIKIKADKITIPIEDINGIEYLGKKYTLREVEL